MVDANTKAWLMWFASLWWLECKTDLDVKAGEWPAWVGPKAIAMARGEKG